MRLVEFMLLRLIALICAIAQFTPFPAQASTYVPDMLFVGGTGVYVDGDPAGRSGAGSLSVYFEDFGFLCLEPRYCARGALSVQTFGNIVSLDTLAVEGGPTFTFSGIATALSFSGTSIIADFVLPGPARLYASASDWPFGQDPEGDITWPYQDYSSARLVLANLIHNKSVHTEEFVGWAGSGPSTFSLTLAGSAPAAIVPTPAAGLSLFSGLLVLGAIAAMRGASRSRRPWQRIFIDPAGANCA
ncbi:MAG: hypothetical protein H5U17_16120 [Defluviimonas sp.]|nr:hypothetical protein [Defluviimonas sp.]